MLLGNHDRPTGPNQTFAIRRGPYASTNARTALSAAKRPGPWPIHVRSSTGRSEFHIETLPFGRIALSERLFMLSKTAGTSHPFTYFRTGETVAKLSRWTIFLRAFFVTLIVGQPGRVGSADQAEINDWQSASSAGTISAYYDYLRKYPAGEYVERALSELIRLGALEGTSTPRSIPSPPPSKPAASVY